jgi:hypothetical protein
VYYLCVYNFNCFSVVIIAASGKNIMALGRTYFVGSEKVCIIPIYEFISM